MKFRKQFFAALCCLLLCACGNQKQISGRVTAYEAGILTVRTEKGKSYDFLVEPLKTSIFDLVSGEEEEALDSNCMVQVIWGRKLGQRTAEHIWIHAKLQSNAMQLSDGTPIDVWKYGGRNEYCLENGTALLVEDNTGGPENVGRWNELLYTEDFPEAAQQGIKDYYGEMGLRYDLGVILEDAWHLCGNTRGERGHHVQGLRLLPAHGEHRGRDRLLGGSAPLGAGAGARVGEGLAGAVLYRLEAGRSVVRVLRGE